MAIHAFPPAIGLIVGAPVVDYSTLRRSFLFFDGQVELPNDWAPGDPEVMFPNSLKYDDEDGEPVKEALFTNHNADAVLEVEGHSLIGRSALDRGVGKKIDVLPPLVLDDQKLSIDVRPPLVMNGQQLTFDMMQMLQWNMVNGWLTETHVSNVATFFITTYNGTEPSPDDPVHVGCMDGTWFSITAPVRLSLSAVFATGSPCRLWFALAYDGGVPRLVVRRCNDTGQIKGFDPRGFLSAVAPPGSTPLVNYANSYISEKPYQVIAFVDYEGGSQSYTVSPRITMVSPNTHLPGAVVQEQVTSYFDQVNTQTFSWTPTLIYKFISPYSLMNGIRIHWMTDFLLACPAQNEYGWIQLYRNNTVPLGAPTVTYGWAATVLMAGGLSGIYLDFPFSTAENLYRLFIKIQINTSNIFYTPHSNGASMQLQEIMV